jgi:hypothetical protein
MAVAGEFALAETVAGELDGIARSRAFATVALEAAAVGAHEVGTRILSMLSDDYQRADSLARMAMVSASPHAVKWADDAFALAITLPDDAFQARLLTVLADPAGPQLTSVTREALLEQASNLARGLLQPKQRVAALARLAEACSATDGDRASAAALEAIPILAHADPWEAENVVAVLGRLGCWDDARRAVSGLGAGWQAKAVERLSHIAARTDQRLAIHLCASADARRDPTHQGWNYFNDKTQAGTVATVAKALARRAHHYDAFALLTRHPSGLSAAIEVLSAPDALFDPLVDVAVRLIEARPGWQRDHIRRDLVNALVTGSRFHAAAEILRREMPDERGRGKLALALAAALFSAGRHADAVAWSHEAAKAPGTSSEAAILLAEAGRPADAAELWGDRAPSFGGKVETTIARHLARAGNLEGAEHMVGKLADGPKRAAA